MSDDFYKMDVKLICVDLQFLREQSSARTKIHFTGLFFWKSLRQISFIFPMAGQAGGPSLPEPSGGWRDQRHSDVHAVTSLA